MAAVSLFATPADSWFGVTDRYGSEKLFPTLLEDFIIFFNIMCVRSQTQDTGLAKALINIPKLTLT